MDVVLAKVVAIAFLVEVDQPSQVSDPELRQALCYHCCRLLGVVTAFITYWGPRCTSRFQFNMLCRLFHHWNLDFSWGKYRARFSENP